MRKLAVFGALFAALAFSAVAAADDGHGHKYGPYDGSSPDSGTCGNDWATDTFQRTFTVSQQNADGTYTVREDFKKGSFVTTAGPSPGGCDTNPGGTIAPGVTGKMQGYFVMVVTGGTFNPDATCATPCTTAGFVAAYFGATATYAIPTFSFTYSSHDDHLCAHHWRNASADRGGNSGDIATTCTTKSDDGEDD
jgi:hypothetical protein